MTQSDARTRLLDAAIDVIRAQGYSATTVDDLCRAAGVTKGAFFHHFASKDAMAVAAARHWTDVTAPVFEGASYHADSDPARRVLDYVAFRKAMLNDRSLAEFTCLVGTMVQETYDTHPEIRDACGASILGHAETLIPDIEAALGAAGQTTIPARSLAIFTQSTLQGAFVLAKAGGDPAIAADCCDHLSRYLEQLFNKDTV
jgi:TetR/AcrR family transcriptional regulator, transcriptional repressor for nem operon